MCCGEKTKEPNQQLNFISMSKKELANEILSFMAGSIQRAGMRNTFSTADVLKIVELHNQFYGTGISPHVLTDVRQAIVNMKALYHSIRRGEVTFEEPEQTTVEKAVEDVKHYTQTEEYLQAHDDMKEHIAAEIEHEHELNIVPEINNANIDQIKPLIQEPDKIEKISDGYINWKTCEKCGTEHTVHPYSKSNLCKKCKL